MSYVTLVGDMLMLGKVSVQKDYFKISLVLKVTGSRFLKVCKSLVKNSNIMI